MTGGEELEQALTGRRNSYVPGHTLQRLLGRDDPHDSDGWNLAMHWGTGVFLGVAAGLAGRAGLRGVPGVLALAGVRIGFDHVLETARVSGVRRRPGRFGCWRWTPSTRASTGSSPASSSTGCDAAVATMPVVADTRRRRLAGGQARGLRSR